MENLPETYTLAITPTTVNPGTYSIIVKATGKMGHKVKNTMFMLQVSGKGAISSSSQ